MAGMLPGVECARRRRFYQGGLPELHSVSGTGRTRRSAFCLYTTTHDIHLHPSSSYLQRSTVTQSLQCEQLEGGVREAKERLDERLRNLEPKRRKGKGGGGVSGSVVLGDLQTQVLGTKKTGLKKFNWGWFRWKASGQDECVVCLEGFESGQNLVNLPCAHRFHSRCLVPWLENNAHCPCCRMQILCFVLGQARSTSMRKDFCSL